MTEQPAIQDDDQRALYEAVPADGDTITNPTLRKKLGWSADDDERYFRARNALEDAGLIVRGRGRGGVVRRLAVSSEAVADGTPVVAESPEAVAESLGRELNLYEPLAKVIRAEWAKDRRIEPLAVEITAQQGRRATGIWARPDIVSIEVRTFAHVPGKYLEVVTFEVKPSDAVTVQAVYEALAHRRAATHAYVLLHVPDKDRGELEPLVAEVAEVARGHGIGVITAADPSDYETWDEREAAQRVEPDPSRLDAFISQQLSDRARRDIALAVR